MTLVRLITLSWSPYTCGYSLHVLPVATVDGRVRYFVIRLLSVLRHLLYKRCVVSWVRKLCQGVQFAFSGVIRIAHDVIWRCPSWIPVIVWVEAVSMLAFLLVPEFTFLSRKRLSGLFFHSLYSVTRMLENLPLLLNLDIDLSGYPMENRGPFTLGQSHGMQHVSSLWESWCLIGISKKCLLDPVGHST